MPRSFSMTTEFFVFVATLLAFFTLLWRVFQRRDAHLRHPPGPPGLPFVGNLRMPPTPVWAAFRDWSAKYKSDVVRYNVMGNNIIVLNSVEAAVDLLERRSSTYSDRPTGGLTMLTELCGMDWALGLLPYGTRWRDGRKVFHRELNINSFKKYRPAQVREVHKFLHRLLHSPDDFWAHTHSMAAGQIISIAYGIQIQDARDPLVKAVELAGEAMNETLKPGAFMVDLIPWLKYVPEWMPGAGFQRQARVWREFVMDSRDKPWSIVKQRMEEDPLSTPSCIAKSLIENTISKESDPEYMELVVKSALGAMYLGGADTTLATLRSFFLAMVLNPHVCHRAQTSLDSVCNGRLPDFRDYDSLPYVHALVKECLRWTPVIAMNFTHRCTADDPYRSFFIPKGSLIIANIRAMMHDPNVYHMPEQFNPDRFLRPSSTGQTFELNPEVRDPVDITFGFGRRICPGKHMAYDSLWLLIANILSVFDIGKVKDKHGEDITPEAEFFDGFICHPKPFRCSIVCRSPRHERLVFGAEERL